MKIEMLSGSDKNALIYRKAETVTRIEKNIFLKSKKIFSNSLTIIIADIVRS